MIKRIFTKTNVLLFLVTAVSVLWLVPSLVPGGNDREIFRCIGRGIGNGLVPYLDFFDHKPPLIYLVYYATEIFGAWDTFVSGTLFLVVGVFLMKSLVSEKSKFLVYLIPIFIIVWLRNPIYYEYGGLSREYSAYLYIFFFFVFLKTKRIEWLAFIAGLVFMNQQNDVLPLLPLLFFKLKQNAKSWVSDLPKFLLIFLMPFILLSIWLAYHDAFWPFVEQGFLFNFKYYSRPGNLFHINSWIVSVKFFIQHINFGIIGLIAILVMNFSHKNLFYAITLTLTFLLGFLNIAFTGRFYGHYFLPMGAILAFFFVSLLQEKSAPKIFQTILPVAVLSFILSILWDNRTFDFEENRNLSLRADYVNQQMTDFIQEHKKEGDRVYIVNYSPGFRTYSQLQIKPLSKYFYFSPWDELPEWDKDLVKFNAINDSLKSENVILFDFTERHAFARPEMNNIWNKTLRTHYQIAGEIKTLNQEKMARIYTKNPKFLKRIVGLQPN